MTDNLAAIMVALLALTGVILREIYNAKRTKPQNMVDDASAAAQFQKMVVDMQKQIDEMREKMDRSHLLVTLEVKLGQRPEVVKYDWVDAKE